jgi:hypothetical protein
MRIVSLLGEFQDFLPPKVDVRVQGGKIGTIDGNFGSAKQAFKETFGFRLLGSDVSDQT